MVEWPVKSDDQLGGTAEQPCYPLNVDDYHYLKDHRLGGRHISQTIVPALCEVDRVQTSEHELSTIPLKSSIVSDPEAAELLSPEGITSREPGEKPELT